MKQHAHTAPAQQIRERAALHRQSSPAFAAWASGHGVVSHSDLTQVRIYELADELRQRGLVSNVVEVYARLSAADRLTNAGLWLVAHMTYADRVRLDGQALAAEDFKAHPEGHTGGALNMVPAYVGYLAANALSGHTRGWLMGQGHCVAAIDAVNVLFGNMTAAHAARYGVSDEGLTRLVRDFYSYELGADGRPASPLGSHVNPNTAGGLIEGGYLGFAELQYVHMPLPGERLVAFLSDGAFEEQRGSDWAARFWRAEDSGLVTPVMIANGRRIDQRTTLAQVGGVSWLREHLRLNGFDPIDIDGRDPAAFAWGMLEAEARLQAFTHATVEGRTSYPTALPYVIAETEKGYGFPGAGTNRAHNLPLDGNPRTDAASRALFNEGARKVWVAPRALADATQLLRTHEQQSRPLERDNVFATRQIEVTLPAPSWREVGSAAVAPMSAIDATFVAVLERNPKLRARVGNPDEMESNRMHETLTRLKHRVTSPEAGVAEAVDGAVITALNEEAVVCAALANKGGVSLVVSYEAFAVKMLGALRQEIIFARHQKESGRAPGWVSVPVVLSSHLWENGKNEQSHQDPTLSEAMLQEMADVSRVVFPADWNSASAALSAALATHGQIWTMVVPKQPLPVVFTPAQAEKLAQTGAVLVRGTRDAAVSLVAIGSYQLHEMLSASDELSRQGRDHSLVYVQEPGRFRAARDRGEASVTTYADAPFSSDVRARVILTHGHPEVMLGVLRPIDLGPGRTRCLGYRNQGGTLDVGGMLRANGCTAREVLGAVAELLGEH